MLKKIFILVATIILFLTTATPGWAIGKGDKCIPTDPKCDPGLFCKPSKTDPTIFLCQPPSLIDKGDRCVSTDPARRDCEPGFSCQPSKTDSSIELCQPDPFGGVFGKIKPPDALKRFIGNDPTGATALSKFLSNFVSLIYIAATIVLVLMLIWGAWDWLTSGGDKEKLESAKKKLINAFIGIILFAVAFALLRIVGAFTGFTFFTG